MRRRWLVKGGRREAYGAISNYIERPEDNPGPRLKIRCAQPTWFVTPTHLAAYRTVRLSPNCCRSPTSFATSPFVYSVAPSTRSISRRTLCKPWIGDLEQGYGGPEFLFCRPTTSSYTEAAQTVVEGSRSQINKREKARFSSSLFSGCAGAQRALGGMLVFAGISHLTFARRDFRAQVPDWVPLGKDDTVLASGVAEIALGASLVLADGALRP